MNLLYPNSNAAGPGLLSIMGIASFFGCLVLMENAVLQASGKEKLPMYTMLVGGVVKIAVNWFLVADPKINIYGAPIGTLVSYLVMFIINFVFMCFALDKNPRLSRILIRPGVSSLLMGAAAWGVYGLSARGTKTIKLKDGDSVRSISMAPDSNEADDEENTDG